MNIDRHQDRENMHEAYEALVALLKARVDEGKSLRGNPYLVPEIQRALKAVATVRGIYRGWGTSWIEALNTAVLWNECRAPVTPAQAGLSVQRRDGATVACKDCVTAELTDRDNLNSLLEGE
jgi:hypothetical protein